MKPKSVALQENGIFITWEDGHESLYGYKYLRGSCRCATCVDEMSGKRVLDVHTIPEDIKALDWMEVGRYAVQFLWTDAHFTGIYPYEVVRKLCPCALCSAKS